MPRPVAPWPAKLAHLAIPLFVLLPVLWAWRPGQIIEDRRDVAATGVDPNTINVIAIGIYHPAQDTRLVAVDANGVPLPHNAQLISWGQP